MRQQHLRLAEEPHRIVHGVQRFLERQRLLLADDMGLGKTLQTLSWLWWLRQQRGARSRPALVICPASVLHNWRREANKFTPEMKVLVLESGSEVKVSRSYRDVVARFVH